MPEALQWIAKAFEPVRRLFFHEVPFFELVGPPQLASGARKGSAPHWAVLVAHVSHRPGSATAAGGSAYQDQEGGATLKEVIVFRDPQVVHVYNVVEYGRRFYRQLVYSSDATFCLDGTLPGAPAPHSTTPMFQAGDPRTEAFNGRSLVITRYLTSALGLETFVPPKLLAGLLPSALLERYAFWQRDRDGNLVGYPLVDDPSRPLYRIEVIDDRTS
jgi:hypothetical protein